MQNPAPVIPLVLDAIPLLSLVPVVDAFGMTTRYWHCAFTISKVYDPISTLHQVFIMRNHDYRAVFHDIRQHPIYDVFAVFIQ